MVLLVLLVTAVLAGCPARRPASHAPGATEEILTTTGKGKSFENEDPRVGERELWPNPPPLVPYSGGPSTPPMAVTDLPLFPTTGIGGAPVPSTGLSVKWKKQIGHTTYRSTIHFFEGRVVVDSNGEGYESDADQLDGVWILNPSDGSTILHIVPPGGGEKDVNGVALTGDALIFGTDQDVLYQVDWQGNVKWQTVLAGDVEAAPALADMNGDTVLDVAAGSEAGVFYVVDGKSAKVMHTTKATQGAYGATGFVGTAALFDATKDSVADVFVPCRDGNFRVIDGKTGVKVWTKQVTSGMHGAPAIADVDGDGVMEVVFTEAYSEVYSADASSGIVEWNVELSNPDGGIEGLFGAPGYYPEAGCVLVGTAWWNQNEGVYCLDGKTGTVLWRYNESKKNITSGFVVGDVDGLPGTEALFGTESGALVALDTTGAPVRRLELGGPVECTPTLADIDGDGLLEILVASNDGFLYALDTQGTQPAAIGYHRGSPQNDGQI